ncbi:PIN domain-containing protein [Nanoarchaeota archaeon]
MKKIIIDTNFILACLRQKIDFFEDLKFMGYKLIIPIQVKRELERITNSKQKQHHREFAKLGLVLLSKKKAEFESIDLESRYVDKGIRKFAKENSGVIVATLDRELKKSLENNKVVIKDRKKLEVI